MVRYFKESLKPSIKVEINQDATQLDTYEKLVAKVVKAKAKAGMQPGLYIQETDLNCPQKNQLGHTMAHKIQTQGFSKDHTLKNNRLKKPKAFAFGSKQPESSKKAWKKKKKKWRKKKGNKKDFINPATAVNATDVGEKKKKKKKDKIIC